MTSVNIVPHGAQRGVLGLLLELFSGLPVLRNILRRSCMCAREHALTARALGEGASMRAPRTSLLLRCEVV